MTIKTDIQPASNILPFIAMIEVHTPNLTKADRDFLFVMKQRCIEQARAEALRHDAFAAERTCVLCLDHAPCAKLNHEGPRL